MTADNRFVDDLAKLGSGAVGALVGLRREFETVARERMEAMLARMDLVTREEFDAVRAVAERARTEQEALSARVLELERRFADKT